MDIDTTKHIRPLRLKGLPGDLRNQIEQARVNRGWGQRELAAAIGLPQPYASAIETGEIVPRFDTLLWCAFSAWIFCSCRARSYLPCSLSCKRRRNLSRRRSRSMRWTRRGQIPSQKNAMKFEPKTLNTLAVCLHSRRIGVINRIGGDRHLFSFEQDYIDDAHRPALSLSSKGQAGGLIIPTRAVATRLPAFFSNLLPEGHLREYLAARAGVKPQREFFLLAALGADLPGALVVAPMEPAAQPATDHAADQDDQRAPEAALRFSLAGVQLKFSAVMETPGGLTIPAEGMVGSWIVKLSSGRFPSVPENEYTMLALARAGGIEVPRTELIDIRQIGGLPTDVGVIEGKAPATQRFDRGAKSETVHMEESSQVFGLYPEDKYHHRSYANIAAVS